MKRISVKLICRFFCAKAKCETTISSVERRLILDSTEFSRKDYVASKSQTNKLLNELINSENQQLELLISRHSLLTKTSTVYLKKILGICCSYLNNDTIIKNPEILLASDLKQKLELLKSCQLDCNNYVNYLTLSSKEFYYIISKIKKNDNLHVKTIQEILELDEKEIISSLARHRFVYGMPINKIRNSLKLFKRFGIDSKNILEDIWCVKFALNKCEKRLQTLKDLNVSKPKTWMARCTDPIFNKFIIKQQQNEKLLQKNSIDEYLANRLNCTVECASKFRKLSKIKPSTILKVNDIINILTKYDYSFIHILCTPRIIHRSLKTIQNRLDELANLGHKPSTLLVLNLTKKEYKAFVEQLKKKHLDSNKST